MHFAYLVALSLFHSHPHTLTQIVDGHLQGFSGNPEKMAHKLVDGSIELHRLVMNNFLPSAVKFFYQFNLRDMSSITQGLCRMIKEYYKEPIDVSMG